MIYIPVLGALASASGTILEKTVLKKRKINVGLYQTAIFLAMVIFMLPFLYFFWKLDPVAFELKNLLILALVILLSVAANLLTYFSMKWEKINNLEPAKVLEPLFVVFLAVLFSFLISEELFERNLKIIIPAFIAGAALIFSHVKKHHLNFNKYVLAAIFGSLLFALELVTSRLILDYYSPLLFYLIRCFGIFLITFLIFRPKLTSLNKRVNLEIFITGALWVFFRIFVYYGYTHLGVIFTTLLMMLSPIFVYFFAHKFLKEKLEWRNIIASIIIVACVVYATVF